MDDPLSLKPILHSKRANLFYLEHCRVMQKDGRVLYLTESQNRNLYWNIPIANTTVILLGTGTSITQAAVRLLASAGVCIGFCGGGGTPLFQATEIEWMTPQNEYRPTEYVQAWLQLWFDEQKRLDVAKYFQRSRLKYLEFVWNKDSDLQDWGFLPDESTCETAIQLFNRRINSAENVNSLLTAEAEFTKSLYRYAAGFCKKSNFVRNREADDLANAFLNHGNYLAYGSAATTLWVLGIPYAFAVMHGKTRRGALVFDVADLIKDAIVLPWAFISEKELSTESQFRQMVLQKFIQHKSLDFMFETVKKVTEPQFEEESHDSDFNF